VSWPSFWEHLQSNPVAYLLVLIAAVKTLGVSFGGYGLMSGLVQGESFYFTYSWGSGIHRSHVGKLQIVNDEVKFWDSGGFFNLDLFLSRRTDGEIAVVSGRFESLQPVAGAYGVWPD
jgi:hypothetical protein